MKKWFFIVFLAFLAACVYSEKEKKQQVLAPKPKAEKVQAHPELTEQEKLIACSQCHKDVTPEVYEEWYNSVHGIANVKCFQCHGTFEDFHVTPQMKKCEACHAREVEHSPRGRSCWDCHPSHRFTVHK